MVILPETEVALPSLDNFESGFETRMQRFLDRRCRIVFLYECRDYGSFRYRCYAPACILNRRHPGVATWFFQDEIPAIEGFLEGIGILVLARMPWSNSLERLLCRAEGKGVEVVFDTDDLVFDSRFSPLVCNVLRTRNRIEVDYWFAYVARRFAVADRCSRYLSTNSFLDERLRSCFPGRETRVVPNFPTFEQFEASETVREIKRARSESPVFLAGYFSGSATHNDDFGMIGKEVAAWMAEFPEVRLRIVGYLDPPACFDELREQGRVELMKATDFLSLQRLIGECDVNLAPLVPGVFADCKSELKFFDAALVETITVASPSFAFREVIDPGRNGFLCAPGSWFETLAMLSRWSAAERRAVASVAREDVLQRYSGEVLEEQVLRAFGCPADESEGAVRRC